MNDTAKLMTETDVVAELCDGMTIGVGGWASRRKPMSLIRAILRSDLRDLTIVSYGGADVGLLARAGKLRKAITGFVSLDTIPLDPHYRAARRNASVAAMELDEGMLLLGLQAAAWNVPFLPTRAGLGTDIQTIIPELRTIRSPYHDTRTPSVNGVGEELIAIERPGGAHFTACDPDYPRDEAFQREYAMTATSDDAWRSFRTRYLDLSEDDYQATVFQRTAFAR